MHRSIATALAFLVTLLPCATHAKTDPTANRWRDVREHIEAGRWVAADSMLAGILARAQQENDSRNWACALIERRSLMQGIGAPETALRELKEAAWPPDKEERAILELNYAQALSAYFHRCSYFIREREAMAGVDSLDLKLWGPDRFAREIDAACQRAWVGLRAWGDQPLAAWDAYLMPNNYPDGIRGTLRDAVTYLWVSHLDDSSLWTPAVSNRTYRFDIDSLLAAPQAGQTEIAAALGDSATHPRLKIGILLSDLRQWHLQHGRQGAALEAELERLRHVQRWAGRDGKVRARQSLETVLASGDPNEPWWSMGQWQLARFLQEEEGADHLVRARQAAVAGAKRHPGSIGGRLCAAIRKEIECPEFRLASMAVDAPGQRTILIVHRNLERLYLRAYRKDLVRQWEQDDSNDGWPEVGAIMNAREPNLKWSVDLPPTTDYRDHKTWTGMPACAPGLYVVAASASPTFDTKNDRLASVEVLISDLVTTVQEWPGGATILVRNGRTGAPVPDCDVTLRQRRDKQSACDIMHGQTDADGHLWCDIAPGMSTSALVTHGDHAAVVDHIHAERARRRVAATQAFIYTDRAVYRPGQTVQWKIVVYDGDQHEMTMRVAAEAAIKVELLDTHQQTVASIDASTNDFGSASGTFVLPERGLLGNWSIRTSTADRVSVRVEEYKRPTFDVRILDPEARLCLDRPITLTGRAVHMYGQPVSSGRAKWMVWRSVDYGRGWDPIAPAGYRSVASGTTDLKADGTFNIRVAPPNDHGNVSEEMPHTSSYIVDVEVTDPGGETRKASRTFRLGTASIVARLEDAPELFVAGVAESLLVVRTDLNNVPRAGGGTWTLYALIQPPHTVLPAEEPVAQPTRLDSLFATPGDGLRPRWGNPPASRSFMDSWAQGCVENCGSLAHDEQGRATLVLNVAAPGPYRLLYETYDEEGHSSKVARNLFVGGKGQVDLRVPLVVLASRRQAAIGDTAQFFVHSGFSDASVYVQVIVGNKIVRRGYLEGGTALVEVPVGATAHRGLVVHASVVRDFQLLHDSFEVQVPWDEKRLDIVFASFRDALQPGQSESFTITVKDAGGKPAKGEALAWMYDRGLDAIARQRSPDLLNSNASPQGMSRLRTNVNWAGRGLHSPSTESPRAMPRFGSDRLRAFPGSRGKHNLDRFGTMSVADNDSDVVRKLRSEGVTVLPPFDVLGARYTQKSMVALQAGPAYMPDDIINDHALEITTPRRDFAETAFFLPHVQLDDAGQAVISYAVPEAVTEWRLQLHAFTRDFCFGSTERTVRTVKELLVRPYLPRFLREGDAAELRVVIDNAGDEERAGKLELSLENPVGGRDLRDDFGVTAPRRTFRVAAKGSATITYTVNAPSALGSVLVRVVAEAGELSDGEQHELPILPGRMHLCESRFAALRDNTARVLGFADPAEADPSHVDEQLVVTIDTQLLTSVLRALPYLVDYPYQCTEQVLNSYLSAGILAKMYGDSPWLSSLASQLSARDTPLERWDYPEPNRRLRLEEAPWLREAHGGRTERPLVSLLDPEAVARQRTTALARLRDLQSSGYGFPWFPDGPMSEHMTLLVLMNLARGAEFGLDMPKDLARPALKFLYGMYSESGRDEGQPTFSLALTTLLNYVLSVSPPEDSRYGSSFTDDDRARMLALSWEHRIELSRQLKAYLALTLHRAGRENDARAVMMSLLDSARSDPDLGVYWAPEDRAWLWYNDAIESHAVALRALTEIMPDDARIDGLVQWLLLHKQLTHWKSTRATAEAIYALLHVMKTRGAHGIREEVRVQVGEHERRFVSDPADPAAGHDQMVLAGEEIAHQSPLAVTVAKATPGLAFASATRHYATQQMPAAADGDLLAVTRTYFRRHFEGQAWLLTALRDGDAVQVGDEIEVHLSVSARHAAEYLHLRDPRPAGCEPEDVTSSHGWHLGLSYYKEIRDSGANFFFEWLPAGQYTLKHRLRATMAGVFRVQPASLQSMYAPEFAAHSTGEIVKIAP